MELKDLAGMHILDAVDYGDDTSTREQEVSLSIKFRLDGVTYAAVEDPEDGYRSSMRGLWVDTENKIKLKNVFPGIVVFGTYITQRTTNDGYVIENASDILELKDFVTGKVVLCVGTDNTDDYYPYFVGRFEPQNMIINQP